MSIFASSTIRTQPLRASRPPWQTRFAARPRPCRPVNSAPRDNKEASFDLVVFPIPADNDQSFVGCTYKDVTFEIHYLERLQASETRFRRLFASDALGIFICSLSGRILEANQAFMKMMRYSQADLTSGDLTWMEITPPIYMDQDHSAMRQIIQTGMCTPFEKEYIRKDGSRVPILIGATMLDANEILCYVLDLSSVKHLELQLRQSQKMEAIGRLAGGVAHDFNNILGLILLTCETIERGSNPDEVRVGVRAIREAAEKAARLTRQLLAFSRKQVLEPKSIDLAEVMCDMRNMMTPLLGGHIVLHLEVEPRLPLIRADLGQVEQVIMNLVVNARDAMPLGGRVNIQHARDLLDGTS
ncbi:MAG: PAS domain S-box protein, partial [Calothrix sp. SM1_5_4]|nr:PAS domain S-box protein [Calothrix sp. SM1_5_4]